MSLAQSEDRGPASGDKTVLIVAYVLYLIGLTHGLTILVALILAYANRGKAGPVAASHYDWIIRTFWLSIGWLLFAVLLFLVGLPLTLIGVGLILIWAAVSLFGLIVLWAGVRLILGLIYLSRDEAYPRPRTVLF